jgi:hypothetical protein
VAEPRTGARFRNAPDQRGPAHASDLAGSPGVVHPSRIGTQHLVRWMQQTRHSELGTPQARHHANRVSQSVGQKVLRVNEKCYVCAQPLCSQATGASLVQTCTPSLHPRPESSEASQLSGSRPTTSPTPLACISPSPACVAGHLRPPADTYAPLSTHPSLERPRSRTRQGGAPLVEATAVRYALRSGMCMYVYGSFP